MNTYIKNQKEQYVKYNLAFIYYYIFYICFFSGNIENVSNGIFTSLTEVVNLCLTFLGTMCLWNGIMEIAKRTTLIRKLTIFLGR